MPAPTVKDHRYGNADLPPTAYRLAPRLSCRKGGHFDRQIRSPSSSQRHVICTKRYIENRLVWLIAIHRRMVTFAQSSRLKVSEGSPFPALAFSSRVALVTPSIFQVVQVTIRGIGPSTDRILFLLQKGRHVHQERTWAGNSLESQSFPPFRGRRLDEGSPPTIRTRN